ncbi:MAG: RsfS/YbeB/iojap family protein [Candidatus Moduliflexus flocculans]|nr:RsfS/YbeB/iojap family protein [Candidatus Moduliflexus flocculans]
MVELACRRRAGVRGLAHRGGRPRKVLFHPDPAQGPAPWPPGPAVLHPGRRRLPRHRDLARVREGPRGVLLHRDRPAGVRPRTGPGGPRRPPPRRHRAARVRRAPLGTGAAADPRRPPAHPGPGRFVDGRSGPRSAAASRSRGSCPGPSPPISANTDSTEVDRSHGRREEKTVHQEGLPAPVRLAVEACLARKAEDLCVLDLRELSSFTDFFLVIERQLRPARTAPWPRRSRRRSSRPASGP